MCSALVAELATVIARRDFGLLPKQRSHVGSIDIPATKSDFVNRVIGVGEKFLDSLNLHPSGNPSFED